MVNGCQKGKAGERELAKQLNALFEKYGVDLAARRGQQYNGLEGQDVVTDLDFVHIECKRVEKLNLYAAVQQAEKDANGKVPIVCHRRNLQPWLVTLPLDEMIELALGISKFIKR